MSSSNSHTDWLAMAASRDVKGPDFCTPSITTYQQAIDPAARNAAGTALPTTDMILMCDMVASRTLLGTNDMPAALRGEISRIDSRYL